MIVWCTLFVIAMAAVQELIVSFKYLWLETSFPTSVAVHLPPQALVDADWNPSP